MAVIENFQGGNLGLQLADTATPTPSTTTITGDIAPDDIDPNTAGIQAASDANGNPLGTAQAYEDILRGTAADDPLLNKSIQNFDFTAIVGAYDQARGSSCLEHWNVANSLLAAHLSGSDTEALGGDLAHQYGMNGSFTGVNLGAAQDVFNAAQFGSQAQTLAPLQGLQGEWVTLKVDALLRDEIVRWSFTGLATFFMT